jgi:hypothetical protein
MLWMKSNGNRYNEMKNIRDVDEEKYEGKRDAGKVV